MLSPGRYRAQRSRYWRSATRCAGWRSALGLRATALNESLKLQLIFSTLNGDNEESAVSYAVRACKITLRYECNDVERSVKHR